MRIRKELTDRLYALHPVLHINEGEALAMAGAENLHDAMQALYRATGNTVIVTMGARGACFIDEAGVHTVPGTPAAHVVDTIGAGDSHAGATLLGLCRGMTLKSSLAMANRVSAAVVETDGATLSDEDFARVVPV